MAFFRHCRRVLAVRLLASSDAAPGQISDQNFWWVLTRCELPTSFNPFQPPESRDQPRPTQFTKASFFGFLTRGLLCAGLFLLMTGLEQLLPEVPFKNAETFTGGIRTVLCTGLLLLFCGWLVQSELSGTWFFVCGTGLALVTVIGGYFLVVLLSDRFQSVALGPFFLL